MFAYLLKVTTDNLKKFIDWLFGNFRTVYFGFKKWYMNLDFSMHDNFVRSCWKFGDEVEDRAALLGAEKLAGQLDGELVWIQAQIASLDASATAAENDFHRVEETLAVLCMGSSGKERELLRSKYRRMVAHQIEHTRSAAREAASRMEALLEQEVMCAIECDVVNTVVRTENEIYNEEKQKQVSGMIVNSLNSTDMEVIENITRIQTRRELRPARKVVSPSTVDSVTVGDVQVGLPETVVLTGLEVDSYEEVEVPVINSLNNKPYRCIENNCNSRASEFIRRYVRNKNILLRNDELSAMTVQRYVEAFCNELNFDEGSKAFMIRSAMVCAIIPDEHDYHRLMVLASPEVQRRFQMMDALSKGF